MPYAPLARQFEDIEVAGEVRPCIGARIFERIAHARLRAQMHDCGETLPLQRAVERGIVRKVAFDEAESLARRVRHPRQPVALERYRVVIVEIVDPDHPVAARAERLR